MTAWPLYGTSLSTERYKALVARFKRVVVWLDRDKFREAWDIADRLRWAGLSTKVVLTDKDPKEYTDDEIQKQLE